MLRKLQLRSPLALKATLKLVRMAEQSTYLECLAHEFNVMTNLLLEADFSIGIADRNHQWSKRLDQISAAQIDGLFVSRRELQLNAVEDALLPTKHYYFTYPDNVRKYLNEQTLYGDLLARAS